MDTAMVGISLLLLNRCQTFSPLQIYNLEEDLEELYNLRKDLSETRDLSQ